MPPSLWHSFPLLLGLLIALMSTVAPTVSAIITAYKPAGVALDFIMTSPKYKLSAAAFGNMGIVDESVFAFLVSPSNGGCAHSFGG